MSVGIFTSYGGYSGNYTGIGEKMIQKANDNKFMAVCDCCGCKTEEFGSWDEVHGYLLMDGKKIGWTFRKDLSGWKNICPECNKKLSEEAKNAMASLEETIESNEKLLKPCPFCGKSANLKLTGSESQGYSWSLRHETQTGRRPACGIYFDSEKFGKAEIEPELRNFIKRWNKRSPKSDRFNMKQKKYRPLHQILTIDEIANSNAECFELDGRQYNNKSPLIRHKAELLALKANTLLEFIKIGIWECEEINDEEIEV